MPPYCTSLLNGDAIISEAENGKISHLYIMAEIEYTPFPYYLYPDPSFMKMIVTRDPLMVGGICQAADHQMSGFCRDLKKIGFFDDETEGES